jgi:aryl-alcohol dehydrogenase
MLTDALVNAEPGAPFVLQKINVDENIRDDEVLIEIKATGVCHTDLNFSKETSIPGLFPAVFGHEGKSIHISCRLKPFHILSMFVVPITVRKE